MYVNFFFKFTTGTPSVLANCTARRTVSHVSISCCGDDVFQKTLTQVRV